jgi:hypothetical protein
VARSAKFVQSGQCIEIPDKTRLRIIERSNDEHLKDSRVELVDSAAPISPLYIGGSLRAEKVYQNGIPIVDNNIYSATYGVKYACKSGDAAAATVEHSSEAQQFIKSGYCLKLSPNTKYRYTKKFKDDGLIFSEIEILGFPPSTEPLYISGTVSPMSCSAGDIGPGGQVNRMERGKDGQVYLKRYMITTKCVNGQMRSFTTPLD